MYQKTLLVIGARQTGKTTYIKKLASGKTLWVAPNFARERWIRRVFKAEHVCQPDQLQEMALSYFNSILIDDLEMFDSWPLYGCYVLKTTKILASVTPQHIDITSIPFFYHMAHSTKVAKVLLQHPQGKVEWLLKNANYPPEMFASQVLGQWTC